MCSSFIMEPGLVELVRTIAEAFPERTVYLQAKITFTDNEAGKAFVRACTTGLANVVLATDSIYSLFGKARYAFSDPSTAAVEAPQFGVYGFATDVSPARTPSMLLKIPQFCVTSGMQAVQRIRDLEADRWHYPIDDIGRFIDLSGQVFCDRVREDLGLPRLEEPRAAWPTPAASKVAKQAS